MCGQCIYTRLPAPNHAKQFRPRMCRRKKQKERVSREHRKREVLRHSLLNSVSAKEEEKPFVTVTPLTHCISVVYGNRKMMKPLGRLALRSKYMLSYADVQNMEKKRMKILNGFRSNSSDLD